MVYIYIYIYIYQLSSNQKEPSLLWPVSVNVFFSPSTYMQRFFSYYFLFSYVSAIFNTVSQTDKPSSGRHDRRNSWSRHLAWLVTTQIILSRSWIIDVMQISTNEPRASLIRISYQSNVVKWDIFVLMIVNIIFVYALDWPLKERSSYQLINSYIPYVLYI